MELNACLCRYTLVDAPGWGGRTPGSQTPGVPATLGLNVQKDGGRKMLQTCSKLPSSPPPCRPNKAHHAQLQLCVPVSVATEMSTDFGDELNLRHLHCRKTTSLHDHRDNRRNCTCGTSEHLHNRGIHHLSKRWVKMRGKE